ncbi:MAG: hypothetical protein KTM48_03990 [Wolbachia endosymbiont of Pissodes strobi]|nr:hypothetical protein [Wolbachia endosymbiont of Pissodes strobi]
MCQAYLKYSLIKLSHSVTRFERERERERERETDDSSIPLSQSLINRFSQTYQFLFHLFITFALANLIFFLSLTNRYVCYSSPFSVCLSLSLEQPNLRFDCRDKAF